MKSFKIAALAFIFVLSGCGGTHYSKKDSELLAQGIYGTSSAIDAGQIQAADKLITDTKRLVTPPKKPLSFSPVIKTTTNPNTGVVTTEKVIIMPEKLDGATIRVNSAEYNELLKDKKAKMVLEAANQNMFEHSKKVNVELQKQEKQRLENIATIEKQNKEIKDLKWYRNIVWGFFALLGTGVIIFIIFMLLKLGIIGAKVIS